MNGWKEMTGTNDWESSTASAGGFRISAGNDRNDRKEYESLQGHEDSENGHQKKDGISVVGRR